MAFWTYIVTCADGSYYTGHTEDLERRLGQHNEGLCSYTKKRRPVILAFAETFPTREEALARERQIKGWVRAKKEALIRGDWDDVIRLSRSRSSFDTLRTNGIGTAHGQPTEIPTTRSSCLRRLRPRPPVPTAHEAHQGGHQHHPDERGIHQHRDRQTHPQHLHQQHLG